MTYSSGIVKRYHAIVKRNQDNMRALIEVLNLRAAARADGRHDEELQAKTRALAVRAAETQRDYLRLRADMIDEELRSATPRLDSFQGLKIPDFMPGEDLI